MYNRWDDWRSQCLKQQFFSLLLPHRSYLPRRPDASRTPRQPQSQEYAHAQTRLRMSGTARVLKPVKTVYPPPPLVGTQKMDSPAMSFTHMTPTRPVRTATISQRLNYQHQIPCLRSPRLDLRTRDLQCWHLFARTAFKLEHAPSIRYAGKRGSRTNENANS